jgi:O-antigen/teichoic acid export membrane protein
VSGLPPSVPGAALAGRLRDLGRHTVVYGLGPVLGQVASFLLLPLYTHLLSPTDYGTLEIIVLAAAFLNVFLGLQIVTQLLRLYHGCERDEDRHRVVSTALLFTAALTAGAAALVSLFRAPLSVALFGTDAYGDLLRLALWSVVATNVFAAALAYLQARKMSRAFTALSVAQLVGTLSLNLLFVAWWRRGVEGILLSQLLVTGSLALGLSLWVLGRVGVGVSPAAVRTMLGFGLPMIGWSAAVFVVNAADRMVLSAVASLTDVGVYSLANRFAMALLVFVVTPFAYVWASERFALARQPDGRELIARTLTYVFVVLCFVALAVAVWMDELVRAMAAPEFWGAADLGPVLVLAYVLWGSFDALMTGILIDGRTGTVGLLTGLAAAAHVGLCWLLGRTFGAYGVAWAKVITLGALTVGVYLLAQRCYPIGYRVGRLARVLGVAVALFLLSQLLDGFPLLLGFALKTPLVLAFPLLLLASGFLDATERRWLAAHIRVALTVAHIAPAGRAEGR